MKKSMVVIVMTAVVMSACIDGIPDNPFLQLSAKPERYNVEKVHAELPHITAHPQDAVYSEGAAAVALEVVAEVDDGGELSYQWYSTIIDSDEGGTEIPDATATTYTPPTDAVGIAYYYVIVTNTIADNGDGGIKTATAVSHTAQIEVNKKIEVNEKVNVAIPLITDHPQDEVYTIGATAVALEVIAEVSDGGTLSYQWYRSETDSNENGTTITDETGTSYTPPTDVLSIVYYYVVVTNTIADNGDGGVKSASVVSNTAKIEVNNEVNAAVPALSHLQSAEYTYSGPAGITAASLTVDAEISDNGTLSYQWYSNTEDSNQGGSPIDGETETSYTPTAVNAGAYYYYVIVTNTIADNGDGGNKSAVVHSSPAAITVVRKPVTITLTASNKTYDSTTAATVSGTTIHGNFDEGNLTAVPGSSTFANANVGPGKTVTFSGWTLGGSAAPNYTLTAQPAGTTANIAAKSVTITVTVSNKTYNASTAATVTGTPTINGNLDGANLTVVAGTAAFANADAGNGKTVTFSGWTLGGSAAGNYTLSAQPASVTANITKANPTVTWPTGLTGYYGFTLANITLPGNGSGSPAGTFTWTTSSTLVGDLGTRSHNMTFTPTNTTNYNTVTQNVSIVVRLVEMVNINSGTFTMGSPSTETGSSSDERPQRQVTLSAFSLGKYEITQAQYEKVMGTNPSNFTTGADAGETQSRRPVEQVSWYDALVFCNKLSILEGLSPVYRISGSTDPAAWGTVPTSNNATWNAAVMVAGSNGYRLPTEAQWEYACRAGTTTAYNTGATINNNTGWYTANSGNKTHEVGKKPPNAWGLYDMHGNVGEWCWDWFGTYPSATQTDPVGASSGSYRVNRGGCWDDLAQYVRSAFRSYSTPSARGNVVGFRVLRP
jgi:formylglycine-generating enzyme required for sulfatase activity